MLWNSRIDADSRILQRLPSGITPDNVTDYLPYADAFFVATGVSGSFTELDPGKVLELVRKVRDTNLC
jgi:predicted TIM-barrel enzyme